MGMSRKYIQFNDLVIDNYDMLSGADLSGNFKVTPIEYSFGHGSYASFGKQLYSGQQSLSLTLKLDTRKLSCEQRKFYKDYVLLNLTKPGRIWAIEGEKVLWAYAYVGDYGETYSVERYFIEYDVDLVLYEGIWHKADVRKTFLQPYISCNFAECIDFREADENFDCCIECSTPPSRTCPTCACDCEFLTEEYSLGMLKKKAAESFYMQCNDTYKIIYNCEAGKKIWGTEKMLGEKVCKEEICKSMLAGQFYSDTILDSENIILTIIGTVKNPLITVNGNTMRIKGEYSGTLTLMPDGSVCYQGSECCNEILLNADVLEIPDGSTLGFTAHHGTNGIIIETNNCCDMTCAYIKVDSITI